MVIRLEDMKTDIREQMRGGTGQVSLKHVVPHEMLPSKARLFSVLTFEKDCGIGLHEHNGEIEVFYVLQGEGVLDDNGVMTTLRSGDCHVCGNGSSHAISNEREESLILVAAIILE